MLKLRDYQQESVSGTRQALRSHRSVMLQAPTGAGKTAMASFMMDSVSSKGKVGFFICHRRELVEQTAKTFDRTGIKYGYIASGYPYDPRQSIYICSIDTLKNRLKKVKQPDFCIWDEAHHLGAAGWTRVHEHYDTAYHVGLSATPARLDGKGLDDRFDYLVPGPSVSWLIEQGYLAKYKLYSVPGVDLSGVHTRMGDYKKDESEKAMDKRSITGDIISHWKKYASDKLTIGFAVSVIHSQHICEQFRQHGIMAAHLDGTTDKGIRRDILRSFARGDIRVLFNVGLFAEGFDIAANSGLDVTVGAVIDAAPTQALGAWLQRCGRALRKQSGHAIILDHSGNVMRHGMPCQEREWTLEGTRGNSKKKSDDEPTIAVKQCEKCYHCHLPAPVCPECGHVYKVQARKVDEVAGELQEVDPAAVAKQQRIQQGKAGNINQLIAMGYSKKRAEHILKARHEKADLQRELKNLRQAAKTMGYNFPHVDISRMKPKALRESIETIKKVMHG